MKLSTGCADGPFFPAGASRVQVEQARFDSRRCALAERPLTRLLTTLAIGVADRSFQGWLNPECVTEPGLAREASGGGLCLLSHE
jgi:hypothetical protein